MKNIFTIFGLLALIGWSSVLKAQVPTNGLVGYWPFNGNTVDASGNGHNGTVHGATLTTDRFGNANSAYEFVLTRKDYIELDNIIGKVGTSDFSIH